MTSNVSPYKYGLKIYFNAQGLAKRVKRDFAGALADFNKAIELKPTFAAVYSNRGLVRQALRDWQGVVASNLSIANMNFEEFANAVEGNEVFCGFSDWA